MHDRSTTAAVRRVLPVAPPLDAVAIPPAARRRALDGLAELTAATRTHLDDPDLFHRPRWRPKLHLNRIAGIDPAQLAEQLAAAAETRSATGLLAVHSVRAELLEHPGRRPCFTPDALAELHRMLIAGDPNITARGGFRRSSSTVTWPDGQIFSIATAAGPQLRERIEYWHHWGTRTTAPPLDAAALAMAGLLTIHPFADANGRTARLLAQCDLVAAGLLPGLLLDLDAWAEQHHAEHDTALVAAADGDLTRWGALFARAVTETARHRTRTLTAHGRLLDTALAQVTDDPAAVAVLTQLRAAPAVSAAWLRDRVAHEPQPALDRLRAAGILTDHPRLPGALIHPQLLELLDTPYRPDPERKPDDAEGGGPAAPR
ncbi:Fic/DOC family protein [Streptomyces sp. 3211.6]|uniref:Fic family protein n=1 Tax=Streptomyces TaxID=1883 RepID=UPI0009A4C769|nr:MULTISPECIES: Fic family protein [Streptomyces]RKT08285.1 Fic/DOC family protein [Streptomyces sp. 3211.6]RPF29685.1 Fic/DOC family protein [Streptomyces sp. Ag109_G2-6]